MSTICERITNVGIGVALSPVYVTFTLIGAICALVYPIMCLCEYIICGHVVRSDNLLRVMPKLFDDMWSMCFYKNMHMPHTNAYATY